MIQKDEKTEVITVYKREENYFEEKEGTTQIQQLDKNTLFDCTEGNIIIVDCIVVPIEKEEIRIKPMSVSWTGLKNDLRNFQELSQKFPDELIAFYFKVDKPLLSLYLNGKELKTYKLQEGQKEFLLDFNRKKVNIQMTPEILEMQAMYAFICF